MLIKVGCQSPQYNGMRYMNYLSLMQLKKNLESFDYILRIRPDCVINPRHNWCELIQNLNLDGVVITD